MWVYVPFKGLLSVVYCLRKVDSRQRCNFAPSLYQCYSQEPLFVLSVFFLPCFSWLFFFSVHSLLIVLSPIFFSFFPSAFPPFIPALSHSPLIRASSLPGRTPTWKSTSQRIAMQTSSPMTTPEWCSPRLTVRAHVAT